VGYWSFEDNRGSTATDFSGFGNDGTLTNMNPATDWVDGRLGTALDFDGSDDQVTVGDDESLDIGQNDSFTSSVWFKWFGGDQGYLISKRRYDTGYTNYITDSDFGANLRIRLFDSEGDTAKVTWEPPQNKWTHLVTILDRSNDQWRVYANGELVGTDDASSIDDASSPRDFVIGSRPGAGRYFDGQIDNVRIYDRALTEANVQDLYQSGFAKVNTSRKLDNIGGLTGWWTMDGRDVDWSASSGQIKDNSSFGNDGTTNGGMTNSQSAAQGRVGQALNFDGVDDRINVGSDSSLDGSSGITVTGWFYGPSGSRWISKDRSEYWNLGDYGWEIADSNSNIYDINNGLWTSSVSSNEWTHVTAVYNQSTGFQAVYLDGSIETSQTLDPAITIGTGRTRDVILGCNVESGGCSSEYYSGKMDDTRLYNQALSTNQIQRVYNATRPSPINTSRTNRLTDGLVGFWSMNGQDVDLSDSAAEVKDVSGNGNDGNAKNGAKPAIGKLGQGFGFDGTDDYVDVGNPSELSSGNLDSSLTMSAWLKPVNASGSRQNVAGKNSEFGNDNYRFWVDSGDLNAYVDTSGSAPNIATPISSDEWSHAVMTYDGNSLKLYLNGVKKVEIGLSGDLSSAASPFTIGSRGGDSEFYDGAIDNVRIYDRDLSEQEVKQLYRLGQ